jgi:hypothetical protein
MYFFSNKRVVERKAFDFPFVTQQRLPHSFAFVAKGWVLHSSPPKAFSTPFHSQKPKSCDEQPLLRKVEGAIYPDARKLFQPVRLASLIRPFESSI